MMTMPNPDAETPALEPDGIRMLRQEYSADKVEEILASIRRGIAEDAQGFHIPLREALAKSGIRPEDVGLEDSGTENTDVLC